MVAGYYLFLCLVGFAVLLGPTGAGIPIALIGSDGRDHELATPSGHDPTTCDDAAACHIEEFDYWNETNHAQHVYYNDSATGPGDPYGVRIGPNPWGWVNQTYFNSSCAECHTSGYNATGGVTFDAYGVNCFACHNSSGYVDYTSGACQDCHTTSNPEHPSQWTDYSSSAHANSLTDLLARPYASSYCMHCMSSEAFIYQQNGADGLAVGVNTTFDPHGGYNSIGCPTCHAVHANYSSIGPAMIRAVNATQLCAECHVGERHDTYNIWYGGSHHLAGVECIDCHGYDLSVPGDNQFMNHTWAVDPDIACGQSDCHDGTGEAEWAIAQLEMKQEAFDALVEDLYAEAEALTTAVLAYNATEGADHELVAEVITMIEDAEWEVYIQEADGSHGFHDSTGIMEVINEAYRDILEAKAYFYENTPPATVTVTDTVTVTETVTGPSTLFGYDAQMVLIGGSVGGIVIGLILGVLVGRR